MKIKLGKLVHDIRLVVVTKPNEKKLSKALKKVVVKHLQNAGYKTKADLKVQFIQLENNYLALDVPEFNDVLCYDDRLKAYLFNDLICVAMNFKVRGILLPSVNQVYQSLSNKDYHA